MAHLCTCKIFANVFLPPSPCPLSAMPVDVLPIVKDWMDHSVLCQWGAVYSLMSIELGVSPEAAESHQIILIPVMKHVGTWVAIDLEGS